MDIVVLAAAIAGKASVVAQCSPAAIAAGTRAGDLIKTVCAALGGKGGGKPDAAMGGGPDPALIDKALASLPLGTASA
ncbi:MAG: hypothetical protein LBR07_09830 [Puniceicoccales bacterium]|nr:hypothetical protein [Puniceicoccales bacterium]